MSTQQDSASTNAPNSSENSALIRALGFGKLPATRSHKKILILMSDTGGGHRASAKAIETALGQLYPGRGLEVEILDIWSSYAQVGTLSLYLRVHLTV